MIDYLTKNSAPIGLLFFIVSLVPVAISHFELRKKIKDATGLGRMLRWAELLLLWCVPLLGFIATKAAEWASEKTEIQITTLSNDLARTKLLFDPVKQPIVSVSAGLKMTVKGTNQNTSFDPRTQKLVVSLMFGRRDQVKSNNWALILNCRDFTFFGSLINEQRVYSAEFGNDSMRGLWNVSKTDTIEMIDTWDTVVLHAIFLSQEAEIMHGEVQLVVNSTIRKIFPIPHQKHYIQWSGSTGRSYSVFENADTNKVNVNVATYHNPQL